MLLGRVGRGLDERRVKYVLALFFLVLAVPAAVLVAQAYRQLKWEALHRTQAAAEELTGRIDTALRAAVAVEEARGFGDYAFLSVEGDAEAHFVQRSPLSAFPIASAIPGVIGYFQVDPAGTLTTPLLPEPGVDPSGYGVSEDERRARQALEATIRGVLAENELAQRPVSEAPPARDAAAEGRQRQAGAEARAEAKAADSSAPQALEADFGALALRSEPRSDVGNLAGGGAPRVAVRRSRTEQALVPEPQVPTTAERDSRRTPRDFRVRVFESELDAFEVRRLASGPLVMFRNAWRDGRRYVQGAVIDPATFAAGAFESAFAASSLAGVGDLRAVYAGSPLRPATGGAGQGGPAPAAAVYRSRLSPPFGDLELVFVAGDLPLPAGGVLLGWVSVAFAAVLCGGFFFMHGLAVGQIRLARQQRDFVSAVGHELKTPLTSIRMYGEMLKSGWADEARKQAYYEYIHAESERLSRLIENVLQLARFTHSAPQFELKRTASAELLELVRAKVATQVERAGFALEVRNHVGAGAEIAVDADCFTQIFINLVDNALKFSVGAERKIVAIACREERDGHVLFTVRDYGPGVAKGQLKRIFDLFYRPVNELTRETAGTGIGLALVRQLATAMGGRVEVRNCNPGAEFRVSFDAR